MGLDGKTLWVTMEGKRRGPFRIALIPRGDDAAEREDVVELIPGFPDDSQRRYLSASHVDNISSMGGDSGRFFELEAYSEAPS